MNPFDDDNQEDDDVQENDDFITSSDFSVPTVWANITYSRGIGRSTTFTGGNLESVPAPRPRVTMDEVEIKKTLKSKHLDRDERHAYHKPKKNTKLVEGLDFSDLITA